MYVKSLKINNYKSFWESEEIPFEKGFNLIVGQNDAGKSALLECLLPGIENKPHRSLLTAPEIRTPHAPDSVTTKRFHLTPEDIKAYLSAQTDVGLPSSDHDGNAAVARIRQLISNGGDFRGDLGLGAVCSGLSCG